MLKNKREEINKLDNLIIEALEKRFKITKEIGFYKSQNNINILNQGREEEIINKIINGEFDNEDQIIKIYQEIMIISKDQQNV